MNRREFLKISAGVSAAYACPYSSLWARVKRPKFLLLIELNGGNDGLNTIIPFRDPMYKKLRPTIGLSNGEIIQLSDQLAIHQALEPLYSLWQAKILAIVNGVGYENPNRSHFRSIEIWDTASNSDEYLSTGWLSRVIPGNVKHPNYLVDGVVIGRNATPLSGNNMRTIVMNTIGNFTRQAKLIEQKIQLTKNPALAHILGVQSDIKDTAQAIEQKTLETNIHIPQFQGGRFGKQLQEAAKLIVNGTAAPVIKVSIGSFDTHANQKGVHQLLLSQLAQGITSFYEVMRDHNLWNDVIMMTYSEFSRRAKQNASQGTDHGTAAPHFLIGGRVKGGFYGQQPSLNDLQDNDLRYTVDFRNLYNTIAINWWENLTGIDHSQYPALDLIA